MPMLLGTWLIVFPNLSKIEYLGGNMKDIFLSCFQFDFKFWKRSSLKLMQLSPIFGKVLFSFAAWQQIVIYTPYDEVNRFLFLNFFSGKGLLAHPSYHPGRANVSYISFKNF